MEAAAITRMLPEVFERAAVSSPLLRALVESMAELLARPDAVLTDLDRFFRPQVAAPRFLPALASWLDCEWLLTGEQQRGREPYGPGVEHLRAVLTHVCELSSWRGTATGLTGFLQLATGVTGFEVRTSEERAYHVVVVVPPAAEPHLGVVERVVHVQAPACVTTEIVVAAAAAGEPTTPDPGASS